MPGKTSKKSARVAKKGAAESIGAKAIRARLRATERSAATQSNAVSASKLIDARIKQLGDWRGKTLGRVRAIIREADPQILEGWKWQVPVWSHAGQVCTGETYKNIV